MSLLNVNALSPSGSPSLMSSPRGLTTLTFGQEIPNNEKNYVFIKPGLILHSY